jgi:hypothetical protein
MNPTIMCRQHDATYVYSTNSSTSDEGATRTQAHYSALRRSKMRTQRSIRQVASVSCVLRIGMNVQFTLQTREP